MFFSILVVGVLDCFYFLGGGILIYLRRGFVGVPLEKLSDSEETSRETARQAEWLEIGVGAQILRDLGARKIRIISGREVGYVGLDGFGIAVSGIELLND